MQLAVFLVQTFGNMILKKFVVFARGFEQSLVVTYGLGTFDFIFQQFTAMEVAIGIGECIFDIAEGFAVVLVGEVVVYLRRGELGVGLC